jgi:hypothetical protein
MFIRVIGETILQKPEILCGVYYELICLYYDQCIRCAINFNALEQDGHKADQANSKKK